MARVSQSSFPWEIHHANHLRAGILKPALTNLLSQDHFLSPPPKPRLSYNIYTQFSLESYARNEQDRSTEHRCPHGHVQSAVVKDHHSACNSHDHGETKPFDLLSPPPPARSLEASFFPLSISTYFLYIYCLPFFFFLFSSLNTSIPRLLARRHPQSWNPLIDSPGRVARLSVGNIIRHVTSSWRSDIWRPRGWG